MFRQTLQLHNWAQENDGWLGDVTQAVRMRGSSIPSLFVRDFVTIIMLLGIVNPLDDAITHAETEDETLTGGPNPAKLQNQADP